MTEIPELPQGGEMRAIEARLTEVEDRVAQQADFIGRLATGSISEVPFYMFPGGRKPQRQTDGAVGYDCYARAIVDRASKPTTENPLRRCRADFFKTLGWQERLDPDMQDWVVNDPTNPKRYGIALPAGERCMVGLGFATAMPLPLFYFVLPRSGHASIGINLDNSPGTVDPDYRGEAGALITNRSPESFVITHNTRIIQAVFMLAIIPELKEVDSLDQLPESLRGVGGFGSTGVHS